MPPALRHVVVGAGLAGARTVQALRDAGSDERIVLVGQEAVAPYHRPPLSKDYLAARTSRQELDVLPEPWYRDNGVELVTGVRVRSIDTAARSVSLDGGRELGYDGLVLATGSSPRSLEVPGADASGVLMLRTLEDSERLREALGGASSLVIVGGGWIGLEVASLAVSRGLAVTVVEQGRLPLGSVLGPEMAGVFLALHRDHGVRFLLGREVARVLLEGGRAAGVHLADGTMLPADLVLVAVGATPNTGLLAGSVAVDGGVLVDDGLRTDAPGVFAVGDIASAYHPFLGRRIRVEHWANADRQPAVAARNLLGGRATYDALPYFFTDQYDLSMEYAGSAPADSYDSVVVRGDLGSLRFSAFWLSRHRVLAAMSFNVDDVIPSAERIIRSRAEIGVDVLGDPSVELGSLADRVTSTASVDLTDAQERTSSR